LPDFRGREWVDDAGAEPGDLERMAREDEAAWEDERADCLIY
jgi:hypothetical protein